MGEPKEIGKSNKPAEETPGKGERGESKDGSKTELVDEMIGRFKKELDANKVKMTVGDYIRLVQLRNELVEEEPKEIRVTWVEPTEKEYENKT
jgi:hypothetical protein